MDEDDSQDELINRSTSHNKGKRAALWAISDDSEDNEAESDEGESDSGEEEEEEDNLDGEDDEEEEEDEEEEDDEEEENAKAEGGAFGGTSADLAEMSSDEDADKCPICLNSFSSQPVATPEDCEHYFCLDCILEWAKNANSCPVDRIAFNSIYLRKCFGGKVKKVITVQKPVKEGQEEIIDVDLEQTNCEVCGSSDREDRLLLCDGCDAGYHMECLTPPLDSVPVEEWFCPECVANNRNSRGTAEELSETESLPSSAVPTTSRSQSRAPGPTRAIARTQQSERVRANVNRHRITQARTSQLAPTYMMQSTWLDDTINAVVAGLNTAVYIRNFAPRIPSSRRRKTVRRRRTKKTSSAKGRTGKAGSTGVKRRRRRVRRTKSRRKLALKKSANARSRIANNLGIVKDKKSSSLPTVYRPSEHTLSNMRADIGAASLSIYGDPFDLDPFTDREEEEQQHGHVTSLLEAKRRGISRSALRSHQPVARPVTGSLSRRAIEVPQSGGVVEAAPVPDLLGSILTGQSMLLMDSSDVVINRDGSLKSAKPMIPSASKPGCSSGDASPHINPVMSPNQGDACPLLHNNGDLPGSSHNPTSRPFSQSSSRLPHNMPPSASRIQPSPHSDLPPRGHPSLQPPRPIKPTHSTDHRGTNRVIDSTHPTLDSSSKNNQPKKTPIKPMWVDVSVLPRIPKIKKESSDAIYCGTSPDAGSGSDKSSSSRESISNSTPSRNVYGMPDTAINSLAGDKGRQQSVDQQKGRAEGRQRPDGASSSSAFSNSFSSSSSSSTGFPSSQSHYSSSSAASSSVSFRINSSGNSWQSRRLSVPSSSSSAGGGTQEHRSKKEDDVRKKQLHRDKEMLLATRTQVKKEQDSDTIYDPFDPTLSDSSSSDDEAERSQSTSREVKAPRLGNRKNLVQNKQDLVHVKTETQEIEVSPEEPRGSRAQENTSQEVRCSEVFVKTEKESGLLDPEPETLTFPDTNFKKEPGLDGEEMTGHRVNSTCSAIAGNPPPVHHSVVHIKTERVTAEVNEVRVERSHNAAPNSENNAPASSSAPIKKKLKAEVKTESESPSRDLDHKKKTSHASKERRSSSSDTERGRRGDHHTSSTGGQHKEKEKNKDRSSRRSRSRERRKACSTSESSQSNSPDRNRIKRQRSRSRSKDRRRSRSGSSSSSREHSRRKKHKQRSNERTDGREREPEKRRPPKDKRHARSRSKSLSRSRSRSRSKDRKRGRSRSKSRSKSRSRSRSKERRKDHTRPQQSSLPSKDKQESRSKDKRRRMSRSSSRERRQDKGSSSKSSQTTSGSSASSSKDTKPLKKKEKDISGNSLKVEKATSVKKEDTPICTAVSEVTKQGKDLKTESQATTAETFKEFKVGKEIKKEKQPCLDMFEDTPIIKPIKEEVTDTLVWEGTHEEGNKEEPVKTERCEMLIIKSEPSSPELCALPSVTSLSSLTAPVKSDSLQDSVPQSHHKASADQPNTVESTLSVKQQVLQPSDSDDDFNVDVMLDNLDYVKSEPTGGSGATIKQEKDTEGGKNEGEQVSSLLGAKSKTHVKRVTWNIQEPEGPQPEKSSSKLALYKLRLKQEGLRRPSSTSQSTSQDITGTASDASRKGSRSSRSDAAKPEGLPTTGQLESEEGDTLNKDKYYLKKLHMQERAIEEVKLAIKPFYQRRDINKEEYKEILRKAVQKVCHSKSGEINPVKVGNLVKAYVDKYKHARKHKRGEDTGREQEAQTEGMKTSDSP
ncbi:PHD and RING finger domain-containing protein 1 isoform X2 [Labrus bergylta]|uniref:PHD and RING finger domain-containing protein 1 isoform X2 n=1 Tax=Labrus bergylta TaxID=56723 RepID=UPI003313A4B4